MIWQSAVFVRHKFWIKDWPVASLQHRALNWQANFLSVISFWKKHQNLFSVRSSIQAWFSVCLICDNKNFPAWEISVSVCQFFSCRNLFSGWKNVLICAMPCRVSWYGNTEGQVVCFKCQQVHFAEKTNPSWQMIWQSAVFVRHKFWIKDWPVASLQHKALNWQANFLSVISFWKNSQKLLSVQVLNSSLILCQFNLWQKKTFRLGKIQFQNVTVFLQKSSSGLENVLICAMVVWC